MFTNEQMAQWQRRHKQFSPPPTPSEETMPPLPTRTGTAHPSLSLQPPCSPDSSSLLTRPGSVLLGDGDRVRARGRAAQPGCGMALMALRSGSLDISGQPGSSWASRRTSITCPGRAPRHHLAPFNGPFSSGSWTAGGAAAGLIVFSWHFGTGYCLAPNELFCN